MQVYLEKSGQAKVLCDTSQQSSHIGGEVESIDKDGVEFALGAVVCERYELICNTEGDQDLVRVPRVVEDVFSVSTLFGELRCQGIFYYSFGESSTLLLYETLRECFCTGSKQSTCKTMPVKPACGCDAQ